MSDKPKGKTAQEIIEEAKAKKGQTASATKDDAPKDDAKSTGDQSQNETLNIQVPDAPKAPEGAQTQITDPTEEELLASRQDAQTKAQEQFENSDHGDPAPAVAPEERELSERTKAEQEAGRKVLERRNPKRKK